MSQIGSHDTMSYLTPKNWWKRLFHFVGKCQEVTIEEQYDKYEIRFFDIRVRYNTKKRVWEFAHGSLVFKGNTPDEVFRWLNDKCTKIYIRLILEYNKEPKDVDMISTLFVCACTKWIHAYPNLTFFEFRRKYDWKQLYSDDDIKKPTFYQAVSSMTWKIWDDWCPWIYAYTHNSDNIEQGTNKDFLLIDFVNIR